MSDVDRASAPHDRAATARIAVGAGFAGDRYEPAEDLARRGDLDALSFECLAERTIALAHADLRSGRTAGWDARLLRRLRGTLPGVLASGGVVVTNAGAANPRGAAHAVRGLAEELGIDVPVGAVTGDDVLGRLDLAASRLLGSDETLDRYAGRIVSANAYTGAAGLLEALQLGARVVVGGRTSDAALFLAPLAARFGWDLTADRDEVANGLLVGHLLECGGQLTGGYFADGDRKAVPDLAHLGFPYADVTADGRATYRLLPGAGGRLDEATVLEQLLYEIDDPTRYLTPDGVLDLSHVQVVETGPDEVVVHGARLVGTPEMLKVSVGIDDGFLATGEISYAGAGCRRRGELAAEVLMQRWTDVLGRPADELRCDLVGVSSARPWWSPPEDFEPPEVRVRAAVRTLDEGAAGLIGAEVEALYTNGPAGGGGVVTQVRRTIGLVATLVPRDLVTVEVEVLG